MLIVFNDCFYILNNQVKRMSFIELNMLYNFAGSAVLSRVSLVMKLWLRSKELSGRKSHVLSQGVTC